MTRKLTPADVVFAKIGPPAVVAGIIGKDRTTVTQWRYGRPRRPAGDIPSDEDKRALLNYARAHGIDLTAEELIFGAELVVQYLPPRTPVAAE
jgi:hypothetical protein